LNKWTQLDAETVFSHPLFRLQRHSYRLPTGKVVDDYYVLEENDVACVFGLTPDHRLILVEQYKHGIDEIVLELPAGYFADEAVDREAEARREFGEETGYTAPEFAFVGALTQNPTRMNNRTYLFAAVNAVPAGPQALDPNESITVRLMPLPEVFDSIRAGRINAVGTVAGIFMGWDYVSRRGWLNTPAPASGPRAETEED
jgi:ADP-ribose pyrophosphatase